MHELDSKEFKRQRRWVKVFLTVALVSGALALLQAIHLHYDPMAERQYGRLVHVRIADRDFAIPSEYFRGPIPQGDTDRLHLWMMMPNFTPYRNEISGNPKQIGEGIKRHLIVDIENAERTNGLASRYNANRNGPLNSFRPQDVDSEFGLRHTYVWYSNKRSPDPWILNDLYYQEGADRRVTLFIRCDRDDASTFPGCSFHEFQDGRLLFTLSYRKANLPNWQDMQSRVQDLIDSFSCVPHSTSISNENHNGEKLCPR